MAWRHFVVIVGLKPLERPIDFNLHYEVEIAHGDQAVRFIKEDRTFLSDADDAQEINAPHIPKQSETDRNVWSFFRQVDHQTPKLKY